ncbi:hypothetical protein PUNSTDRAFT_76526 [Punctularia strigosozonata HHB-11173 SS5]|uniref:Pentacotripeptide-repeat region of PRORP domain-containing protein n=1 Tax=Punctularia strigosozonata (strain HHB-11173) TaxID=741275 RepID=R7S392_PUNST|nr:uncharacterized protein PUNSTDRAFT_76526 [Punctularia strigosozonata HHB-11173 SS5]EIN04319.1 hypothetical protein PUNSTDRAFT_76526 [Punctularia strigosozonata HHB-11173 SS5]
MLTKVANHLIQHTSRVVAAVQNQSSHALKNALQGPSTSGGLGGWNGAGSSSYGGGAGAGPGGAKYHSSSRFYHGYTGAGRAITQANTSSAQDGQFDDEESQPKLVSLRSSRGRSSSVVTRSKLGVLKAVQLHIQSQKTFSSVLQQHRSNSTAATATDVPHEALEPPPKPPPERVVSTDPAAPQTVNAPDLHHTHTEDPSDVALRAAFSDAVAAKDGAKVLSLVATLRSPAHASSSVQTYNTAFSALNETRKIGSPINVILELYNDMVARSVLPSPHTYTLLIYALTSRDMELQRAMTLIKYKHGRRQISNGWQEVPLEDPDASRLARYEAESASSFSSAMALFTSLTSVSSQWRINFSLFVSLLRCAAHHANIDAAIQIFAQLERQKDTLPPPTVYLHMMAAFVNANDFSGAQQIFAEFLQASRERRVNWPQSGPASSGNAYDALSDEKRAGYARMGQILMWNKMIEAHMRAGNDEAAVGLLEEMMDSPAEPMFGETDVPPAASSTFTTVITGFCRSGDVTTALTWFNRLLEHKNAPLQHPFASSRDVVRPDSVAWNVMMEHLSKAGMVDDFNRLYVKMKELRNQDGLDAPDTVLAIHTNLRSIDSNPDISDADAVKRLDFIKDHCLPDDELAAEFDHLYIGQRIVQLYVKHHAAARGADIMEYFAEQYKRFLPNVQKTKGPKNKHEDRAHGVRGFLDKVAAILLGRSTNPPTSVPLPLALRVGRLCREFGQVPTITSAAFYLEPYYQAKRNGESIVLEPKDWETLALSVSILDLPTKEDKVVSTPPNFINAGSAAFLNDLKTFGVPLDNLAPYVVTKLIQAVYIKQGAEKLQALFTHLGREYEQHLDMSQIRQFSSPVLTKTPAEDPALARPVTPGDHVRVDKEQDKFVSEWTMPGSSTSPNTAYARFEVGAKAGVYPTIETIGRLINGLGRVGEVAKVQELYDAAQLLMSALNHGQRNYLQRVWFTIEDQMVIALAHAGQAEQAHTHRTRVIEQGGAPSADAYGALIQCVKDTTDDTANAMALFDEAQARGVQPNVYLYNTIISKLAKARKADHAIELFQQMKANNIRPTSVTYGAIISACCRVGDAHSAELLFQEMASQPNFKPRVPPFNTMMQLYTQIKPDRSQVLRYYDVLRAAGVRPSAHTYKASPMLLLLDAYGTIEPVDPQAMEKLLEEIIKDPHVQVQGTHWASLIHSYGCVQKNLDKAIEIFESLSSHPANQDVQMPDSLVFEALINVFVTLRRPDLIPGYVERLKEFGLHMTAYIANLLIKGYAAAGQLDESRRIFESLVDPPMGIAAPNNHAPHEGALADAVPANAPPSTWEAMIRAELGAGNREQALGLLDRLQARQYPQAVFNRISGIMLEDSVSPWPASPSEPNTLFGS